MIERFPTVLEDEALRSVLVVEDEILIRMDITDELRRAGYAVLEARSVEEAQHLLAAHPGIDLVFSDFQLKGKLDGWDLHRAVSTEYPGTGFILTSAQNLRPEWRENGVLFVPKPYRHEAVLSLIGRIIDDNDMSGHANQPGH